MPGDAAPLSQQSGLSFYFETVSRSGIYPSAGNLRFHLETLFEGVPLAGRSLLEIGGGAGVASFYAAFGGAARVICLEPESSGSSESPQHGFEELARRLRRSEVVLCRQTVQQFDPRGERFDVLLMNSSINHLDEEACIHLRDQPAARDRYHRIFARLADWVRPGGILVAVDSSPWNALGSLGIRHPLARFIDWEKHQAPKVWVDLLSVHGFSRPRVNWLSPFALRAPGRALLGNAVAAFFLTSTFRLVMTRDEPPPGPAGAAGSPSGSAPPRDR